LQKKRLAPVAGLWDFDGGCKPKIADSEPSSMYKSFSVAVFQWIPKSSGKGLKRSKSIKRISGSVNDYEMVYAQAELFCVEKETGQAPA
jgi:hypothetical protein